MSGKALISSSSSDIGGNISSVDLSILPLCRLLVRNKNDLVGYEGPVFVSGGEQTSADKYDLNTASFPSLPPLRLSPVFNPNGGIVCLAPERQQIALHNAVDGRLVVALDNDDAQKVEFSPLGRYLVTWSLPHKGTAIEAPEGNLRIWSTATGAMLAAYNQKSYKCAAIQWTADERYSFRQTTNELCIYEDGLFLQSDCIEKIQHKGFSQYKITQFCDPCVTIAFFNPEAGGKPARITLYSFKKILKPIVEGPLGTRTIFGASEATLMWNKQGTSLLIHSQTDVDSSNASYYGATSLYIMNSKGDISHKVEQTKEGPVHDVSWSPEGDK
jgi:translation initiation factor 2A